MVSEGVRAAVWDGLLEVSRAVHYYAAQKKKHQRHRNIIRFFLAAAGTGALLSLINLLPGVVANVIVTIGGALVTGVVIWEALLDPTKKAAYLEIITSHDLPAVERLYRSLWEDTEMGRIDTDQALETKRELLARLQEVTSRIDVEDNDEIQDATQADAFTVEEQRYA